MLDTGSRERRYYLNSPEGKDAAAVCGHWSIENVLHWCLDVCFGEEVRQGHAAEHFSRLSRLAMNLLRRDRTIKVAVEWCESNGIDYHDSRSGRYGDAVTTQPIIRPARRPRT